jgi:hypothetical protein
MPYQHVVALIFVEGALRYANTVPTIPVCEVMHAPNTGMLHHSLSQVCRLSWHHMSTWYLGQMDETTDAAGIRC